MNRILRWVRQPLLVRCWEGPLSEEGRWRLCRVNGGEVWEASCKTWDGRDRLPVGALLRMGQHAEWLAAPIGHERRRFRRRVEARRYLEACHARGVSVHLFRYAEGDSTGRVLPLEVVS